ncbi:hypothetical protein BKG76_18320 [Mycobacteroides franklinii]|uniref:Uncharacterized protein n=1 Tax=Mycobacteroides franklinii TaxID=948102 RepID=A0A1S1LE84_9MYCO|nr:hypothetical protein BKG76_18320 [Mycobacteroides franklinii]
MIIEPSGQFLRFLIDIHNDVLPHTLIGSMFAPASSSSLAISIFRDQQLYVAASYPLVQAD